MALVKNYFIQENPTISTQDVIAELAVFYASNYIEHVYVIRKTKLDSIPEIYKTTDRQILKKIIFLYPKTFSMLLEKILEMPTFHHTPKVLIIESLHNWRPEEYSLNLALDLSPIIAALQNLMAFCSKKLNSCCYSFCTSRTNVIPNVILDLYYYKLPLVDITERDKLKSLQEAPAQQSNQT